MEINSNVQDLKTLIKEAVREVIKEEKIDFFIQSLPYVSQEEMQEIENVYGRPEKSTAAYKEDLEI
ncbi:MAG: hypothetical protein GWP06_14810 [Actinobacteria bacterium]|nr:hypothetical protein [Actinomycetota bacterium]